MFINRYKNKIKTLKELKEIIGAFPRDKKVVMCHGVFDIVHPGHLRHLLYAKNKTDILIASCTADKHISKGVYRPLVPQDIRAANLAAFEFVDYVIIDPNPTPIPNIKQLQPDYFAKGFEYTDSTSNIKTKEEENTVNSYGGAMIFTPGDIIYSSSHLINKNEPSLSLEKLSAVLETRHISIDNLLNAVKQNTQLKIHVVGDTIVDGFMYTNLIGGQTKSPTLSVQYESQKDFVGGAGIVAKHLKAAGVDVTFTTVLGQDALAKFVYQDLQETKIKLQVIEDETRPTTYKNAIIADKHRLIKVDTLDNTPITENIQNKLVSYIQDTACDVVIFSDFRHGIFNKTTVPIFTQAIPKNTFKVADSQVASRWGNISEFKGFDLITPNEREARFSLGDQDSGIRPLASTLYNIANCKTLILKMGAKGLLTCSEDDKASAIVLDSFVKNLVDPVGSGDALLAYASILLASGHSPALASIIGAVAAACECEREGNIPISKIDVLNKLKSITNPLTYISDHPNEMQLKKVVNFPNLPEVKDSL